MKHLKLLSYFLIVLLALGFTACSDDSSGPEEPDHEAPSISNLTVNALPDISFFQNNNQTIVPSKRISSTIQNFTKASGFIFEVSIWSSISDFYVSLVKPPGQGNAEFFNGQWVWEYSSSLQGQPFTVRTMARPQGSGFDWASFISGEDGPEFQMMKGNTRNDGNQGELNFFHLTSARLNEAMTSKWNIISDIERTISLQVFTQAGVTDVSISYEKNGAENLMNMAFSDQERDAELFWNTDSNIGYITQEAERLCWDTNFQDIACSELGL